MVFRDPPDRFVVAFSLAGEQKARVRPVAEAVEAALGRGTVFLDEWFEHVTGGTDGDLRLQAIYSHCQLAIVCVSRRYGEKAWPQAEFAAIRARVLNARASEDARERDRVFMLRFGEGDVEGILPNDIVPDVQQRSAAETAELILARLRRIDQILVPDATPATEPSAHWPAEAPPLDWQMADHLEARDAFAALLTDGGQYRYLGIRGEHGVGKTRVTKRMQANVLRALPEVACGRLDFKGTTDIDVAFWTFAQDLGLRAQTNEGGRWDRHLAPVLNQLRQRATPTLLIFDGYSGAPPAVTAWVDAQLMPSLIKAPWLRVVIAGANPPRTIGSAEGRVIVLKRPTVADWFEYGRQHDPTLEASLVEQICRRFDHDAALLDRFLTWRQS